MGNQVTITAKVDDKVTGPLGRMRDQFDTLGKSKGFQAVAQGVGVGAGISAFGLLDRAMSGVISLAGDSVKAYQEEQDSVSRLGASLKANIPAWDGNTTAIEGVLTARMKLGFSDEDQRNSLALLVGATHDVNKALAIESTAMDLARFKRISLTDASEALTKVEAGSYRILKSLGIVLKDGATQQDALNAVQKIAMGQAREYADTDLGKLEAAQIKVNEAQERFGKGLSHLEADLLPKAADAIETFANNTESLGKNTERELKGIGDAWESVFGKSIGLYLDSAETKAIKAGQVWDTTTSDMITATEHMRGGIASNFGEIKHDIGTLGDAAKDTAGDFNKLTGSVNSAADALAQSVYGPAQLKGELAKLGDTLATDKKHLHDLEKIKNPTAAQRTDIIETKGQIAQTNAALLKTRVQMALLDGTGLDALVKELEALAKKTGAAGDEARTLLSLLHQVAAAKIPTVSGQSTHGPRRAAGGPVTAGTSYLVGEKGPELFTPGTSGGITPNNALGAAGGPSTVHVHLLIQKRGLREIADAVIDLNSYGRGNPTFAPS